MEVREDSQFGERSVPRIHVPMVEAAPPEALAGPPLESGKIRASVAEEVEFVHRVVVADDPDELDRREQGSCGAEVDGRSADHALPVSGRGRNVIQGDAAHDEDRRRWSPAIPVAGGTVRHVSSRAMVSGADSPSARSPLRSVSCTARASRILAARSGTSARILRAGSRFP